MSRSPARASTAARLRALLLPIAAAVALAGCGQESPGTSVQIALRYAESLQLDKVDVTLADDTRTAAIAHELLLLAPDGLAGMTVPIEVWGRMGERRIAYASTTAMLARDRAVDASLELVACQQRCDGEMLMGCAEAVSCALGCSELDGAHCIVARPSNGVDATLVDAVHDSITISADATFDVDTGAITQDPANGDLSRAAVEGVDAGIGYYQADSIMRGGVPLGIFVFRNLTVAAEVTVRFTGTRAAVLLVGETATIDGTLDVSGGWAAQRTPGPGGGAGGLDDDAAGCGAGLPGRQSAGENGGGGGGGGGITGGPGGRITVFGGGGPGCLAPLLEPLQGGSGGGNGGRGSGAKASGGGGGGALQLTALGLIRFTGVINAGGAGGEPGAMVNSDGGGGGGGGGGGAVLLEAPTVMSIGSSVIAANGGGGGGGGGPGSGVPPLTPPTRGDNGRLDGEGASGGAGGEWLTGGGQSINGGGTGGASGRPDIGNDGTSNGGGGGGGQGAIAVRGHALMFSTFASPTATPADLAPPR